MIDKDTIQSLTALPIEGVAGRLGFEVRHHKCLCPFHEDKHPSLTFNPRTNRYRCFVCGANGSTIDLVMNYQHLSFVEACKWLAQGELLSCRVAELPSWAGVNGTTRQRDDLAQVERRAKPSLSYAEMKQGHEAEPNNETTSGFDRARYERFVREGYLGTAARQFLFDERKIDPRVVRWCRLTSWRDRERVDWLQIPYYDMDWHLTGIQWRRLGEPKTDKEGNPLPRFRFPRGSRCHVYNLPVLKMLKEGEPLFITEGASDCWAMLSSGRKAIAIPSATLLKRDELRALFGSDQMQKLNVHIFPDQDAPGEALFLALRELLPQIVRHQLPEGIKDFGEWWKGKMPKGV